MSDVPTAVSGLDELRQAAEAIFVGLPAEVMEYRGRVGVALPYRDTHVFVVPGDDGLWYPTHGFSFEPCAGQPVHDTDSFYNHMAEWTAGV